MSQDVFDFLMIILGIVVAIVVFIYGFWVLDRSRRGTNFYSLGYSLSSAWAGRTSTQLNAGELSAMPMQIKDLERMAHEEVSKSQAGLALKAETQVIASERDRLKDEKEDLERLLKEHGIQQE